MRAILIDPYDPQRVAEIDVNHECEGLYEAIGCQWVECGPVISGHMMFVNGDEQRNLLSEPFFSYDGYVYSGRAVILGLCLKTGASLPCTMTVEEVTPKVRWTYPVLGAGGIQFVSEVPL